MTVLVGQTSPGTSADFLSSGNSAAFNFTAAPRKRQSTRQTRSISALRTVPPSTAARSGRLRRRSVKPKPATRSLGALRCARGGPRGIRSPGGRPGSCRQTPRTPRASVGIETGQTASRQLEEAGCGQPCLSLRSAGDRDCCGARRGERQGSRLVGLALRPEPGRKPEGHQRALAREAMSPGEQRSDLQGQDLCAVR